jgi:hypothetical protein
MARGASAWNQAIPTVPELTFSNELYQTAVYQMLGQPLPVLENMRQCLCGGDLDVYGNHFASKACRQSLRLGAGPGHGLTARHDAVKNAWMYLARKAGVKVTVEQAALPGLKATRRGDVTFHGLHDGADAVGDVMVGSIYHEDGSLKPAALEAGGVLKAAEHSKRKKYAELGSKFLPLIFETHGRMNDVAENTLKLLAKLEAAKLLDMSSVTEAEEQCGAEWSTLYCVVVARSRQFISAVLAKQMALAVRYGVADTMATRNTFPDFSSGRRVDPLDDELVSAALGAPVGATRS